MKTMRELMNLVESVLVEYKQDDNGLYLNDKNYARGELSHSQYKNVTALKKKLDEPEPWLAYFHVSEEERHELVMAGVPKAPGLGFDNIWPVDYFGDERDAAFVGQKLAQDREETILRLMDGEDWESIVGQIPNFEHRSSNASEFKEKRAISVLNKGSVAEHNYKHILPIMKSIFDETNNQNYADLASMATQQWRQIKFN